MKSLELLTLKSISEILGGHGYSDGFYKEMMNVIDDLPISDSEKSLAKSKINEAYRKSVNPLINCNVQIEAIIEDNRNIKN